MLVGCVDPDAAGADEAELVVEGVDVWLALLLLAVGLSATVLARMVRRGLVVALAW